VKPAIENCRQRVLQANQECEESIAAAQKLFDHTCAPAKQRFDAALTAERETLKIAEEACKEIALGIDLPKLREGLRKDTAREESLLLALERQAQRTFADASCEAISSREARCQAAREELEASRPAPNSQYREATQVAKYQF